jgi:hypothetical protein
VYEVAHAWRIQNTACASLFSILAPGPLARTTVLLIERPFEVHPTLWLKLATSDRPLRLGTARLEEPFLGTDLTYDDLRMWTPRFITAANRVRIVDAADSRLIHLRGQWLYAGRVPVRAVGSVHGSHGLPLAVKVRLTTGRTLRAFFAEDITTLAGVSMPSCIRVLRRGEGYESSLEFRGAAVGSPLPRSVFTLPSLGTAHALLADLARTL